MDIILTSSAGVGAAYAARIREATYAPDGSPATNWIASLVDGYVTTKISEGLSMVGSSVTPSVSVVVTTTTITITLDDGDVDEYSRAFARATEKPVLEPIGGWLKLMVRLTLLQHVAAGRVGQGEDANDAIDMDQEVFA